MRRSVLALAALSLWQGATADKDILVPYHPKDLGLQRRDVPSTTVTLQNEVNLLWGSSNGSTFVNMTLGSGETELVISTEYFADSLKSVQCDGDLILQFESNDTFQAAIADWSWVNFAENRTFFMINNWGDCANNASSGRQPWIISKVDVYDEQNFIVNFNATLSTWDVVAGNSVIEFGSMPVTDLTKRINYSKNFALSLAHDLPQTFFSKSTSSGLDFSIDCPGCATTGEIDIVGKIVTSWLSVSEVSLSATPKGVGATLALGLDVSGTLGSGWSRDWNLLTIPLDGWSIPDIIDLGPEFAVDAGFTLSGVNGEASIQAGINAAIPDSSSAVLGIKGVDSSWNGWVPTITPQTPKVSVEVDGTLEVFAELSVDVGLTVFGKYGFGAGLFLRVPDVTLSLGAEFNSEGACAGSEDVFGVTLDTTVGVNLGLGVYTESGGNKDWAANKTLYSNDALITPINKCFPLGPTLLPAASGVPVKTIGTVKPTSSSVKPSSTSKASSSKASSVVASVSSKVSGTAVSSKISGTGVSSSKISGTGVSSSKISGTAISSKISGTGVSSSKVSGTTVSNKVSGTGVSSAKVSGTGVTSLPYYGSVGPSSKVSGTAVSSIKGVSVSGTGVASSLHGYSTNVASSIKVSGTAVSSVKGVSVTGTGVTTSLHGYSTGVTSSIKATGTAVSVSSVKGVSDVISSSTSKVSSVLSSTAVSSKVTVSSAISSSKATSFASSVLGVSTTKSSSVAPSTTAKPSTTISSAKSSSTSKAVLGTTVSGSAPAPTQSGVISTCNKWTEIIDADCTCLNIETQYGVTSAQLLSWNPAIGSSCKLVVGDAVCVGVSGGYKRSVNGRLARFVDA